MSFVNEHHAIIKTINFKILFWMVSGLLYLIVQNVESAENSFKLTQHNVEISGFAFVPKKLEVKPGDTITWVNKDIVPHNIVESIDQSVISPDLATGETYTFVVKKPMVYHCGLHPSMKGKLSLTLVP
ncbi:MAG: plastocyanin/azurin family copper-binding protein [Methylococcaceae bacterium]|nr:plastocyanin/azurin family copper-binding protein [Methylococcaceae bacterium]